MNYSPFKQNLYQTKVQNELFILEFIFFPKSFTDFMGNKEKTNRISYKTQNR